MNRTLVIATTLVFTLALSLSGLVDSTQAQVKPFKVRGGGPAPGGISIFGEDSPHSATGTGTHLGRYSGDDGIFNALSFDPMTASGTFRGCFVFVAANGDRLACTYGDTDNQADSPGEFFAVPADGGQFVIVFCAEFNPIPGESSGRFEDVNNGSLIMLAMSEPIDLVVDEFGFTLPFNYTWDGDGWLEF